MTFDEYAEEHLWALTQDGKRLVMMGWNARGEFGEKAPVEQPVKASVSAMGDIQDSEGTTFHKAMIIQFPTVEDFHAARESGQCSFTVFGGDV